MYNAFTEPIQSRDKNVFAMTKITSVLFQWPLRFLFYFVVFVSVKSANTQTRSRLEETL